MITSHVSAPAVGGHRRQYTGASQVDAAVLVVSSGITRRDLALQAIEKLSRAKSRLLGVVLNQMKIEKNSYYGSYY